MRMRIVQVKDSFKIQSKGWIFWSDIGKYTPYFNTSWYSTIDAAEKAAIEFKESKATVVVKELNV